MAINWATHLVANTLSQSGVVAKPSLIQTTLTPGLVADGLTPDQINAHFIAQNIVSAPKPSGNPLDDIGNSISNVGHDIVSGAQAVASAAKSVANTPIVKGALNDIGDALGSPGLGDTIAADTAEAADVTNQIAGKVDQVAAQVNQVATAVKNSPLGQVPGVDSLANGLIAGTSASNQAVGIDSAIAAGQLHPTTAGVSSNIGFDYQTYDHPPAPQAAPPPKIVFPDRASWQSYARGNVGGLRG